MDNLTHSLFGALAAATTLKTRPASSPVVTRLLVTASIIAGSLPDLDVLYTRIVEAPLGSLLHHRGHTHTLGFIPLGILFIYALFWIVGKAVGAKFTARDFGLLIFLSSLGTLLHLGLDSLNSYGVHPFWPFSSAWYYGDTLFIIEPTIWLTLAVLLFGLKTPLLARSTIALIALGTLGLIWFTSYVPIVNAIIITFWGSLLCLLSLKLPHPRWSYLSWGAVFVILLVFKVSSSAASAISHKEAKSSRNYRELLDTILSPHPGNPLCWNLLNVERDSEFYYLRRGIVTLGGSSLQCTEVFNYDNSLLTPLTEEDGKEIRWVGEYRESLATLRSLYDSHCKAAAFLQFGRAPYLESAEDAKVIGDMRFMRGGRGSFARLYYRDNDTQCPPWLTHWGIPRQDLLVFR